MGAQIGVSHTTHERRSQNGRRPWWRRVRRGTHDGFCCDAARGLFLSRLEYGAFLVAGKVRPQSPVAFLAGSRLAHNRARDGLLEILRKAEQALADQGLTNFQLYEYGQVRFCAHCGANLRRFYGSDAGALRDDAFAQDLGSRTW